MPPASNSNGQENNLPGDEQPSGMSWSDTVPFDGITRNAIPFGMIRLEEWATRDDTFNIAQQDGKWTIPGVGEFHHTINHIFNGTTLPAGLRASDYTAVQRPFLEVCYNPDHANVSGGYLRLWACSGSADNFFGVTSAEVRTTLSNVLYGSFRMRARISSSVGANHGFFICNYDEDFTGVTYSTSPAPVMSGLLESPPFLRHTNQIQGNTNLTSMNQFEISGGILSTAFHDYRLDWTKDFTAFYIDGQLASTLTHNVPQLPGRVCWNNWMENENDVSAIRSNHFMDIDRIALYFNTVP